MSISVVWGLDTLFLFPLVLFYCVVNEREGKNKIFARSIKFDRDDVTSRDREEAFLNSVD